MGLIYLDSCLLIYAIERDPKFGQQTLDALNRETENEFAISPLVKLECLVKPIETASVELQRYYEAAFDTITTLSMPEIVYLQAAQLRARFRIRTPDALHVSCAQHHRCASLWTNDDRLVSATHGLAVKVLT